VSDKFHAPATLSTEKQLPFRERLAELPKEHVRMTKRGSESSCHAIESHTPAVVVAAVVVVVVVLSVVKLNRA
jgi:hypothetical protein